MPLNIEVKGEPASIRETSRWLHSMSGSVDDCGAQVKGARAQSEGGWTGPAGDGFRGVMSEVGTKVDELAGDFGGTSGALNRHADDLDTVRSRMTQARGIASSAGLATTEVAIAEPGPAPAEPTPLPTDRPATAGEKQAHSAATELASAHAAKVRAYHQAADVVMRARRTEIQSQNHLLKFLKGEAGKAPFTIADIATGLAGGSVELVSKYRKDAARFGDRARVARGLMTNPSMSARGQVKATVLFSERLVKAADANHKATATRLARGVNRLSPKVQAGLTAKFSKTAPVFKRVPVVGAAITAAGVTYEIRQGADPGKAITSGAVSFGASVATGAAIGAMVGGPVGVVAGAIVGAGIGAVTDYAIDEWVYDAGEEAVGDAYSWAKGLFD